jgi:hypothetical protein
LLALAPASPGVATIPCGPAGAWAIPSGSITPSAGIAASTGSGGGVEAFRLASSLGSSPPPAHFGGPGLTAAATAAAAPSGIALSLAAHENGTTNGTTNGNGAQAKDKDDKKKPLYPSRVVLTSTFNLDLDHTPVSGSPCVLTPSVPVAGGRRALPDQVGSRA